MDAASATITAAAIGGGIALFGLVANKENKTSEFRQQWIDALREDIASLIGVLYVIEGGAPDSSKAAEMVNLLNIRIHLRFKRSDENSKAFRAALLVLMTPPAKRDNFEDDISRLTTEAQILLQKEWLVVKRGELVYRTLVYSLAGLLVLFVAGAIIHYVRSS